MLKEIRDLEKELKVPPINLNEVPENSRDRVPYIKQYLLCLRDTKNLTDKRIVRCSITQG